MTISCPKCKHTKYSTVYCGGDHWLQCYVCNIEFYEDGFKRQNVYDLHMRIRELEKKTEEIYMSPGMPGYFLANKRMKPSEQ
jgi:hypothetical protein